MTGQMQSWWNSSPYFDIGFYLNGAVNHPNDDTNLNSDWVTAVSGQGWGLMPLWTGEQAPCTPYTATLSWDPNVAEAEGSNEALDAAFSLDAIGLSNTIVYFDMEPYTSDATCSGSSCPPNATTCGAAVSAFFTGWVNGLHLGNALEGGLSESVEAGEYGSPRDAQTDFGNSGPDDVWLTFIPNLGYDTVSVWDINNLPSSNPYYIPNSSPWWSNNQRIIQYTIDRSPTAPCCTEKWGGVASKIDKDIEDGSIVAGHGSKSYGFVQQAIFQAPVGTSYSPVPPIYGIIGGLFPPIPDLSECTAGAPANGCSCPADECQMIGRVLCAPSALSFYGIDPAVCYNWADPTGGTETVFDVQLARAQCEAEYYWGMENGSTVFGTLNDYINAWASGTQGGCELDGAFVCPIDWGEFCANGYGPAPTVLNCPPEYNDPTANDLMPGQDPYGPGPSCYIGLPPVCPPGSIYEPLLESCISLSAAPPATYPTDIQGISDVTFGGTLPQGEIGQVVGFYTGQDGLNHGFLFNPNTGGITPAIDCNNTGNQQLIGPGNTQLTGINNAGQAVGYFQNSSNTFTSFTLDTTNQGAQCQPLPCPGIQCWALGINDADWIVGFQYQSPSGYPSLSGGYTGFVYKMQTNESLTLTLPSELFTAITAVNGQGVITGYYSPDAQNYYGFSGDASQSNISVSGSDFPCNVGVTDPSGINNNGQIVGYSYGELDGQYNSLSSFLVNGGSCNAGFADQYGWTYGLNDDVQIVGETFGLSSSPFSGFVLTPQH